jgi:uncharacterized membrane-anchored protein YhcB (DUF1043 family)
MTWLTHAVALIAGIWLGILFALWMVDKVPRAISKIFNHSPRG